MSDINSFSALGFDDDEAVVAALRTDLAGIVRGYIERSQATQTAMARKLGIPQSTVSAILNDNVERLSIEYFLRILARIKLPWAAKCWNPPHDAQWIVGGISQFVAALSHSDIVSKAEAEQDIWSDEEAFFHDFSATGISQPVSSEVVPVGHR